MSGYRSRAAAVTNARYCTPPESYIASVPPRHLYIHVPFCTRRCSYCDFSIAVRRTIPVGAYLTSLRAEFVALQQTAESGGDPAGTEAIPLDTVYVGGGTPSRLGGDGIRDLLTLMREFHLLAPGAEVTIEANPEDVTPNAVNAWASAGVNRISLGLQTFDDGALQWMHRTHSTAQSIDAIRLVKAGGIDNVSIDLIFGLPTGLTRSWRADVDCALELSPSHISLYGLTVEPSTPLARWTSRGLTQLTTDDRYADEFLYAHTAATAAGFMHYEVSNFAIPGNRSRHNSAYWSGVPYLGVGPSAHSFDGSRRRWNVSAYADWALRLARNEGVTAGDELLSGENRAAERVYLGLRTDNGLKVDRCDLSAVRTWVAQGWAVLHDSVVKLTPEGWLRLDSLAAGLTGI